MDMKHLEEVNESYFTHMKHSLKYSAKFLLASLASLVHAFFPELFKCTSSSIAKQICNDADHRKE